MKSIGWIGVMQMAEIDKRNWNELPGVSEKFDAAFTSFIAGFKAKAEARYRQPEPMCFDKGRRYIRIWNGGAATTFIEMATGDIFKSATWRAPAKHARGNIFDASNGLKNMTGYGPAYLR